MIRCDRYLAWWDKGDNGAGGTEGGSYEGMGSFLRDREFLDFMQKWGLSNLPLDLDQN